MDRREIGEQLYNEITRYATTGVEPEESTLASILGAEMGFWKQQDVWQQVQDTDDAVTVFGHSMTPLPDDWLRNEELRNGLYFGGKPSFVFASSGTTQEEGGLRAVNFVDPLQSALLSAAVAAVWTPHLRELGYDAFCDGLEFKSFGEAVEYFETTEQPKLLVPESAEPRPFSLAISGFPPAYNAHESYEKVPTHGMYVVRGTTLVSEMLADNVVYPVVNTVMTDGRLFNLQIQEVADLLEGSSSGKPRVIGVPTPYHTAMIDLMPEHLPYLREGDVMWSAGGDKAGTGLHLPDGAGASAHDGVHHYNLLGDTIHEGMWLSRSHHASEILSPTWSEFIEPVVFGKTVAYVPGEGEAPVGYRVFVGLGHGLSRPNTLYPTDFIENTEAGFRMLGRDMV